MNINSTDRLWISQPSDKNIRGISLFIFYIDFINETYLFLTFTKIIPEEKRTEKRKSNDN